MIRTMTIDDYVAVFDLWMNTPNMGLRTLDDSREGIEQFLKRNPATCFVAYDGEIVSGVVLCGHNGRRGYIYHTVVHPNYRRQGIGTALIDAAIDALRKEGITRVCLNVIESNEIGKEFWINRGWEKRDFLGFYSRFITDRENLPFF